MEELHYDLEVIYDWITTIYRLDPYKMNKDEVLTLYLSVVHNNFAVVGQC